jgi:hypothetical protein
MFLFLFGVSVVPDKRILPKLPDRAGAMCNYNHMSHTLMANAIFLTHIINAILVYVNVSPNDGLHKIATFSTQIEGSVEKRTRGAFIAFRGLMTKSLRLYSLQQVNEANYFWANYTEEPC